MNAIDLALAAGGALTVGFGLLLIRRRRARTRLDRLSRHRRTAGARRRWPTKDRLAAGLVERPGVVVTAGGAVAGGIGLLGGGPVAAVLSAAYATVTLIGIRHHLTRRAADRAVAELLDAIEDAVGDLRAGVVPYATAAPYPGGADVELYAAPGPAPAPPTGDRPALGATVRRIWAAADGGGRRAGTGGPVGSAGHAPGGRGRRREDAAVSVALARLEAAQRVSEALGTPLADLLDQVEADLRAGQTLRLNLGAQTSGAQTTTTLLVGLPAAGLWLGAGIGVDPLGQLLHTPLGAACAITAVALQCAGLLWTGRMVRSVVAEVR
ncbi:type II secretion system F family protein [Dactylosporangium cerinum]|uniref:Type II secretion system F family protein n=1 Tax=Dactylosporangium cerinum TaxID=1434730 RepID=A0ABV9VZU1_9ACTN